MHSDYFENMPKNKRVILEITLIGILSALSYIGVMINIPIPSPLGKPMIHLGNLVVIISAIMFGGFIGGLSGSIGMGLYDIISGYDIWSIIRTLILKLILGLIVGIIYHRMIKKDKNKTFLYQLLPGFVFIVMGVVFLSIAINNQSVWENITINKKAIIYWPIYSFSILIGMVLIISTFLSKKIPYILQCVNLATSLAIIFNLFGEFIYKMLKQMILGGSGFVESMGFALISVPGTLMNGVITIILVLCVFMPIKISIERSKKN